MEMKTIEELTNEEIYGMEFLGHHCREAVLKLKEGVTEVYNKPATEHMFKRIQEMAKFILKTGEGCWSGLSPDNGGEYTYDAEWVLDNCQNIVGQIPDPNYRGEGIRVLRGESTYIIPEGGEWRDAEEEMYWHDKDRSNRRGDWSRWRPVSERSED